MVTLIAAECRKAKRDRLDDSAEFIIEALDKIKDGTIKLKPAEKREIERLQANNWQIKTGQHYIHQYNKAEGEFYTFCTLSSILRLCHRHNIYG